MDAAIVLDRVSKTFRDFLGRSQVEAVRDLSLRVPRGDIFGLLGPNGSGKTTTLLILLGLLRPTTGRIEILGTKPGDRSVRNRIGFLPEEFSPPDLLTGEEILRYYGSFYPIPRRELRERIDFLLDALELAGARRRKFRQYSKGMRRRIGLAQALLHRPELLVLDEPTNGLDPVGVNTVKSLLLTLKSGGTTVLVSSHMLPEMEQICGRIAILSHGSCICEGATGDVLKSPDLYQLLLETSDSGNAERAGELLNKEGFTVRGVTPMTRSLESVFLEMIDRGRI